MFKKILNKLELLKAEREFRKEQAEKMRKSALECMKDHIRDKAIIYCTQLHASNEIVSLPPTHLVDMALFDLIRNEKDVIKYHKRFPYKELAERWV